MLQVRYNRKTEEISEEQFRLRIADGSLRRSSELDFRGGAKVRSADLLGDDRWHSVEETTEWRQVAPIWHVPPPGPHLAKTALLALTAIFGVASGFLRPGVTSYDNPAWSPMVLSGLGGMIVWLVVVHGMWKSIRGSFSTTAPVMAVVGFFLPIYNVYWLFAGHTGFVKNYNLVVSLLQDRYGKSPAPLRMWPFVAYPIVFLVWAVTIQYHLAPAAAASIELTSVAFRAVLIMRACDAVNALHALRRDSPDMAQA